MKIMGINDTHNASSCLTEYDYVIIGGGIIGLTLAKTILNKKDNVKICVLEKENKIGLHGSGRNSGVLHSGIYYPERSLKAKLCADGARKMSVYCEERGLPINRIGKVIVPTKEQDDQALDLLYKRAEINGAKVSLINESELQKIEPEARTATARALYSPETAVIDPQAVLKSLITELQNQGVDFKYGAMVCDADPDKEIVRVSSGESYKYGMLINATGQHSDRVSNLFQVGQEFTILPFKGAYLKLDKSSKIKINGLIYPLPDLSLPFLGVHSIKTISGDVYFGPTAIPALGRENYNGVSGIEAKDIMSIGSQCAKMYFGNEQGFRKHTHQELLRSIKYFNLKAAKELVPNLRANDLHKSNKVGIRAQLVDKVKRKLEMDFIVRKKDNTVHILNAVSPAFTSSLAIAEYIFDKYINLNLESSGEH